MTEQPTNQTNPGKILYDAGWRQGSLFTSPDICFYCNEVVGRSDPSGKTQLPRVRKLRSREKLVLITHDCDLVRSPNDMEPYVEVLICTVEKDQERIANIDRNSPRWFVISPSKGLVANARYRAVISKQFLIGVSPEPWPESETRRRRFVRWLARRYARPALPDKLNDVFVAPFSAAITALHQENPHMGVPFTEAVYDIRLWVHQDSDLPHWQIRIALLSELAGISDVQYEAVEQTVLAALGVAKSDSVTVSDWYLTTNDQFSLADYFATDPIFFDFLTYQGNEIVGSEPPDEH